MNKGSFDDKEPAGGIRWVSICETMVRLYRKTEGEKTLSVLFFRFASLQTKSRWKTKFRNKKENQPFPSTNFFQVLSAPPPLILPAIPAAVHPVSGLPDRQSPVTQRAGPARGKSVPIRKVPIETILPEYETKLQIHTTAGRQREIHETKTIAIFQQATKHPASRKESAER